MQDATTKSFQHIDSTNLMHEEEILSIYHEVNNILGGGGGGGLGYEQNVQFCIYLKERWYIELQG